jgi:protein Mpv17
MIPTYDPQRTLRFLIFGTLMGPILSKWNHFLEVTFPLRPKVSGYPRSLPNVLNGKPITAAGAVGVKGTAPILPGTSPRTENVSISALAKRVGCDQVVFAPTGVRRTDFHNGLELTPSSYIAQLVLFLGSMGIMEGHSKEAIKRKYVDLFPTAIVSNWKVWPLIQVSAKQPNVVFN